MILNKVFLLKILHFFNVFSNYKLGQFITIYYLYMVFDVSHCCLILFAIRVILNEARLMSQTYRTFEPQKAKSDGKLLIRVYAVSFN